ncbi:MAG: hypothetical protein ACFFCI_06135, partial [Promethearchaeota archaeon]
LSAEKLNETYEELQLENTFMQSFRYVGAMNKESILSKSDEEIANMMQSVIIAGGFITNVVHNKWMTGAENDDLGLVQEAYDFLEFIQPYRQVGADFDEIYKRRKSK